MANYENTNIPPEQEPLDPFASPEKHAEIAYAELVESLKLYEKEHPGVSADDIEVLRWKLWRAIEERDKDKPTDLQG